MTEKSSPPTVQELVDMPENEFLELCHDCDRIDSEYAFKEAGINALSALGNGALATAFIVSGAPIASVGNAVLAGISVWKGIQALGKGVQKASESASADTILQVLYPPTSPSTLVKEGETHGKVTPPITRGVTV
jgi:hypothetical protein